MKKFISFALTAAMVASLVPATAFAKTQDGDIYHGTVSVVNAWNDNKKFTGDVNKTPSAPNYNEKSTPEAQIRITDVDYRGTDAEKIARFTIRLDNAEFFTDAEVESDAAREKFNQGITVTLNPNGVAGGSGQAEVDPKYQYKAATADEKKAMLGKLYDALAADGGSTGSKTSALTIDGAFKVTTSELTADGATGYMVATADSKEQPASAAAVTGRTLLADLTTKTIPGTPSVPAVAAKTATENREAAWAKYCTVKTLTAADYTYTDNLGLAKPDNSMISLDGKSGWYKTAAPTVADSVLEAVVAKAVTDANYAGDYVGVPEGSVSGGVFVATEAVPEKPAGLQDKTTWVTNAVTELGTALTTADIYMEKFTAGKPATPEYGMGRTGIKAEIASVKDMRKNEITVTVTNPVDGEGFLEKGDIISVDLVSILKNSSKAAGFSITSSDIRLTNDNADFTYVNVDKEALVLSARKVVDVAEDEVVTLDDKGLVIKTNVGTFRTGEDNQVNLKISKGFEFVTNAIENRDGGNDWDIVARLDGDIVANAVSIDWDTDKTNKEEITLTVNEDVNEITIYGIDVKAASAKISKVATIKATSNGFNASAAVEVAKVVDYIVMLSVDEDEDVPVIYSGVDVNNTGLTDDSDHWSLEVTAEESFPGAWSFRKGFNFELPEHVFVADVEVISTENFLKTRSTADKEANEVDNDEVFDAFFNAYQNGSHVNFEFDKRVFDDVDAKLTEEPASMTFKLQLVADTGFEGDVALKLTGELVDEQEVTIAKFVKPYEVKAEQNDIIIDYRYTDIPTAITITEAEGGLWDKDNATFRFKLENHEHNFFEFEGDPTFEVDSKSDMSLKSAKVNDEGMIQFTVDSESDEAATIEIKGMQLFMNRSIPAGPYDLLIESSLDDAYHEQMLFAPDAIESLAGPNYENSYRTQVKNVGAYTGTGAAKEDSYVGHVEDCTTTVKEAFVNVVTAGRDQDDASFTTKVVVPVGEDHIFAGEKEIKLDTPAYINEAGYTMLPIRAVAVALGINSNNVLWDQPTKTVTILYGQRIITMTQGQKVVYVNGSAIPASAAVENTNSRTFLPMRDLATALGVTDITWDQASRTATLNGNQK